MRGGKVSKIVPVAEVLLVERLDKIKKRSSTDPFTSIIANSNLGTVRYSSNVDYPEGTQVYFGGQHETLLVEGVELMAMKTENVFAKVLE
jgi:hypothetical protein